MYLQKGNRKNGKTLQKTNRQVFNLSRTAPYRVFMKESGSLSCRIIINYGKIMFYYYIWNSDKERLAKRITTKHAETRFQNSWYTELGKIANKYKIIIDGKYIKKINTVSGKQKVKIKWLIIYRKLVKIKKVIKQGFLEMIISQRKTSHRIRGKRGQQYNKFKIKYDKYYE